MSMSRRRFCVDLAVVTAGAAAVAAFADDTPPAVPKETWVKVGKAADFKKAKVSNAKLPDGTPIIVALEADGGYAAFSPKCTHKGCPVSWNGNDSQFVCPCHGARFDIAGHVVHGPAKRGLDGWPAKVDADGFLVVRTA